MPDPDPDASHGPAIVADSSAAFDPGELERIAASVAAEAAALVRARLGRGASLGTKSSPTDVVTQTDLDSERLIRRRLVAATPDAGFVAEEGGTTATGQRLQWVIDPLDGTVNFLYALPVLAVSIAAALDGRVVAGAVVDVVERRDVQRGQRAGRPRRRGGDRGLGCR